MPRALIAPPTPLQITLPCYVNFDKETNLFASVFFARTPGWNNPPQSDSVLTLVYWKKSPRRAILRTANVSTTLQRYLRENLLRLHGTRPYFVNQDQNTFWLLYSQNRTKYFFLARIFDRTITPPGGRKNLTQPKLPLPSSAEDNARIKRKTALSAAKVKDSFFSCLKLWGVNFFPWWRYWVLRKKLNSPFLPFHCFAPQGRVVPPTGQRNCKNWVMDG